MAVDPNGIEQAVSRTLRDNLEKIQRTVDELHQSVNDLVSACASSRPSNALPSMVRAQTSAASLSATLDVLSRFVTGSLQPSIRSPFEPESLLVPSMNLPIPAAPLEQPEPAPVHLTESPWTLPVPSVEPPPAPPAFSAAEIPAKSDFPPAIEMPPMAEFTPTMDPVFLSEPVQVFAVETAAEAETPAAFAEPPASEPAEAGPIFSLDSLLPEEQELHRRAYRVAKVSMQDIKMLRPEDVRLGRENKDLCIRLRDDIEKAHKEYDRRFQSIQSHPVDYFYDWMVEILGGGDAQALGEYPYPSPVLHR
ncbi:MAG: hypothetical protein LAO08_17185 [Acidobacteriia bacterium]|nr:hypothetical protein [Terriglobia bacterium]